MYRWFDYSGTNWNDQLLDRKGTILVTVYKITISKLPQKYLYKNLKVLIKNSWSSNYQINFISSNNSVTVFTVLSSACNFSFKHHTEPKELPAAIIGEANTGITVTMNSPISLHCYAWGWPRPFVTWWRGDRMLPLSSEIYEQDSEYTLLIRTVTLPTLGVYTCQAFNAIGRAASWSVTLQAIGPVYNVKPEYEQYIQYLVEAPRKPEKPQYPYRPNRTSTPDYQTYAPLYTSRQTHAPTVSPNGWATTLDYGSRFRGERVLCGGISFVQLHG